MAIVDDAANGLQLVAGEVFQSSRQQITDLLHGETRAACDLAASEIRYGDKPRNNAHQSCALLQVPDIEVRASSRRRFGSVCSRQGICGAHGTPMGVFDPYSMQPFLPSCQSNLVSVLDVAQRRKLLIPQTPRETAADGDGAICRPYKLRPKRYKRRLRTANILMISCTRD